MNRFSRTELLLGKEKVELLKKANIAVFGAGGVGSYAIEALARGGIGHMSIFDGDNISLSNINRQLIATDKTIGRAKAEVCRERIFEINPDAKVVAYNCFYSAENADVYDLSQYSYIVDAIDTVSSKLILIERAKRLGIPIISSMGMGNKICPVMIEIADIYETSVCPLARVMRRELKARGVADLKVVYSKETPITPLKSEGELYKETKRQTPGSISFVPSTAGLIIAGEVIKNLTDI